MCGRGALDLPEMQHHFASELPYLAMSAVVAIFGSWTALGLFRRAAAIAGRGRTWWVAAAALAQGLSIWAMHFVAMLGWNPGVPVRYDAGVTAISLVIPILACGGAFWLAASGRLGGLNRPLTALGLGAAICAMHYVGMAALRSAERVSYDPWIVFLSLMIAVGAAYVAIWALGRQLVRLARAISAAALGLGTVAMHYTGMAAMRVSMAPSAILPPRGLDRLPLAMDVGAATLVLLIMAVIVAIFDRKLQLLAEREAAATRRSEQFLRALVEQMPVGVIVAEAHSGRLRHVNAEAGRLLGLAARAEGGALDLMDFPPLARAVERSERTERDLIRFDRADGASRWLEVSAGPVRDETGADRFAVAAFTDVTEQREAEAALRQAQKMEAVGQLTGGIAHDFNNLLTAVIGGISSCLEARRRTRRRSRTLEQSRSHAARRGAALVTQQLLAFSRQQPLRAASRRRQRPGPAAWRHCCDARWAAASASASAAVGRACGALADPTQLELAVLNLAINARDAMPERRRARDLDAPASGSPSREAACEPEPGDYAVVSVEDTGTGMPPEVIEKRVRPVLHHQADRQGIGPGPQPGLGLAQQMGGGVQIATVLGAGTKVSVLLPFMEPSAAHAPAEPRGWAGHAESARGRALLLDDDEDVRRLIGNALEDAGYEIASAASLDAALAQVRMGWRPDVMVIDYAMPGITGEAAEQALREAGVTAKALFITGYSDIETPKGAAVLQKPFEPQDLVRRLAELDAPSGSAARRPDPGQRPSPSAFG